jgi:hypothetical protein
MPAKRKEFYKTLVTKEMGKRKTGTEEVGKREKEEERSAGKGFLNG